MDLSQEVLLNSSKISARVLCLVWGSLLQVKHRRPGKSTEERQRTISNLGNTDTVTISSSSKRNLQDMKTGFKNIKTARQQKEIIYFHLDIWEVMG